MLSLLRFSRPTSLLLICPQKSFFFFFRTSADSPLYGRRLGPHKSKKKKKEGRISFLSFQIKNEVKIFKIKVKILNFGQCQSEVKMLTESKECKSGGVSTSYLMNTPACSSLLLTGRNWVCPPSTQSTRPFPLCVHFTLTFFTRFLT